MYTEVQFYTWSPLLQDSHSKYADDNQAYKKLAVKQILQ
jgi:hypothetical protein